jgi:hypothetical protein
VEKMKKMSKLGNIARWTAGIAFITIMWPIGLLGED